MVEEVSIAAIWEAHRDGNTDATDLLVLHYAPLVKFVCGRLRWHIEPADVTAEKVFEVAFEGLRTALLTYPEDVDYAFDTYAAVRITTTVLAWIKLDRDLR